jgi:hypothetical protein
MGAGCRVGRRNLRPGTVADGDGRYLARRWWIAATIILPLLAATPARIWKPAIAIDGDPPMPAHCVRNYCQNR